MIKNQRSLDRELAIEAGRRMLTAARTAPKAKGVDILEAFIIDDAADMAALADAMDRRADETGMAFLHRDAGCIRRAGCVVLIATDKQPMGLNCAYCGYAECTLKPVEVPCAFNAIDAGIAVGSACAAAADTRVDTRVMFSAGSVAASLGWLPGLSMPLAIPVSVSSKSPFFDR